MLHSEEGYCPLTEEIHHAENDRGTLGANGETIADADGLRDNSVEKSRRRIGKVSLSS